MIYLNKKDLFYYILCSFKKLKLDKDDIKKLYDIDKNKPIKMIDNINNLKPFLYN